MLEQAVTSDIVEFTNPEEAIAFILNEYQPAVAENTILLLDINMPQMTGWQFLEWFDKAPAEIKNSISIYMVSSSIDPGDIERANTNPYIKEFLIKPLKVAQLSL
jgi:CheY-like chemotaxis protein